FFYDNHPYKLHSFPTRRSSDLLHPNKRLTTTLPFLAVLTLVPISTIHAVKSDQRRHLVHPVITVSDRRPMHTPSPIFVSFRRKADRKSTRLNSSHVSISYAVFC